MALRLPGLGHEAERPLARPDLARAVEVIFLPGKRAVEEAFAAANGQQPTARRSAAAAALAAAFTKHLPTA